MVRTKMTPTARPKGDGLRIFTARSLKEGMIVDPEVYENNNLQPVVWKLMSARLVSAGKGPLTCLSSGITPDDVSA